MKYYIREKRGENSTLGYPFIRGNEFLFLSIIFNVACLDKFSV
jgi:hypothetical protein